MTTDTLVTLAKGGEGEQTLPISQVEIPDLWHLAMTLPDREQEMVLDCWHKAHALKRHIEGL